MANDEDLARIREGVAVWNNWRAQNREHAADLTQANLGKAYLGAANLHGANLYGADLSGADLRLANLTGANLQEAELSGADLRRANLTGADLRLTNLEGATLLDADLTGANFSWANLTNAFIGRVRWDRAKMRGRYHGIRGIDSCYGNALFKRAAADQDFLDTLEDRWRGSWRIALFRAWGLLDYGRSLSPVAFLAFGLAALYGAIYSLYPETLDYGGRCRTWFTPFYFSIVTYTTLT